MSISIFLLWLVSIPLTVPGKATPDNKAPNGKHVLPGSQGYLLSCGSDKEVESNKLKYKPDDEFVAVGKRAAIPQPNILPLLTSARYFPNPAAKKYCYTFPVYKGGKFLVKTLYYYGGFDGGKEPPVFDQIIDGTKWNVVNTTEDYSQGLSSYYEVIIMAHGKTLSVCLARNMHTTSSPFISAIEVHSLDDSVYNSTDFKKHALITVARHSFANAGEVIGFPDDKFNRYWQPMVDNHPVVSSHSNVTISPFWNHPPRKIFDTAITTSRGKILKVSWPPFSLPSYHYYIALYFHDNRTPSPFSWRVFDVDINGQRFYSNLNVTTSGVAVFATEWLLGGYTEIILTPKSNMPVGPIINAAEVLEIMPLEDKTLTRDVVAMDQISKSTENPPDDWDGDPCMPKDHSWTGLTCTDGGTVRVTSLNLTGFGFSGLLPTAIANLTALQHLWLGDNRFEGPIPDLSNLKSLETLHLENNRLEGSIPESLGHLPKLRELFLQNNHLKGEIPASLASNKGLNIQYSPEFT
ncbi:hypothetical protein M9H77_20401 [Catharanthus roseus]|uniref:Uncharacterized protein n=1 Tax=Catharanthus roseus TaxID=4058 RepID=A0ACC0AJH9_CATRO|nr:hypothetical protein M9H77_20401 [Catharanthus roseus]